MNKLLCMGAIALSGMMCFSCGNSSKQTEGEAGGVNLQTVESRSEAVVKTIMERRSIRKYKPQQVEESKLQEILKCGINAPNGMYKQSWQVRVVRNPDFLAKIDEGFNAQRQKNGANTKAKAFYGAPCLILIAYDTTYDLSQVDCGLLGGNIITAAQSMGLGTCCLGQITRFLTSEDGKELFNQLDFPRTHQLLYAISLGYPDETPAAKPRDMAKIKFID